MDQAGVPEHEVQHILDRYKERRTESAGPQVDARREIASYDDQDRNKAILELKRRWGEFYDDNFAAAKRHLASMPEAERQKLTQRRLSDGTHALNDANTVMWLASHGYSAQRSTRNPEARIAEIERLMSQNRAAYFRDEAVQAEYRGPAAARCAMNDQLSVLNKVGRLERKHQVAQPAPQPLPSMDVDVGVLEQVAALGHVLTTGPAAMKLVQERKRQLQQRDAIIAARDERIAYLEKRPAAGQATLNLSAEDPITIPAEHRTFGPIATESCTPTYLAMGELGVSMNTVGIRTV